MYVCIQVEQEIFPTEEEEEEEEEEVDADGETEDGKYKPFHTPYSMSIFLPSL